MDLFKKIYDIFQSKKIFINKYKIQKILRNYQIILKKYELLTYIQKNLKINISNTILSQSRYDYFVLFGKEDRRKKLLIIIAEEL